MIKVGKRVSMFCLASLIMVGVSLWGQPPDEQMPVRSPHRLAREKPKRLVESKYGPASLVEPPDLLLVEVLEALPGRPISGERLVRPDGTISLGYYGDVHVAGLTLPDIKEKIVLHMRKHLDDEILGLIVMNAETGEPEIDPSTRKPRLIDPKDTDRVFVDLTAYNSQVYYVEGDVNYPSRLPCTGNDSVLDVIHYVGGIMPSADRSKIRLIRSFPKGSPAKVLPIDYEEITMGTDSSTNYQMLPNDRLVVPRRLDISAETRTSPRTSQARLSRSNISAFSTTMRAGDPEEGQLKSLQALERHMIEVEKKLEKLIDVMQSATKAAQPSDGKAAKQQGSAARSKGEPFADSPDEVSARPPVSSSGRSPFDLHPKPPASPKDE